MKVKDAMSHEVVVVTGDTKLNEIARLMLDRHVGSVVVVDEEQRPIGIITESDFLFKEKGVPFSAYKIPTLFSRYLSQEQLESVYSEGRQIPASEVMTRPVRTITEETDLWKAASMMHQAKIKRLPVTRDGRLVGIVARRDLLKSMAEAGKQG